MPIQFPTPAHSSVGSRSLHLCLLPLVGVTEPLVLWPFPFSPCQSHSKAVIWQESFYPWQGCKGLVCGPGVHPMEPRWSCWHCLSSSGGSWVPCHTGIHVCLLQEIIHLCSSCWELINGYGFCDPVINSLAHNCLKTKRCSRSFSPSQSPHAIVSVGTKQSIRTWIFLPGFCLSLLLLHTPHRSRRRKLVRTRAGSMSQ